MGGGLKDLTGHRWFIPSLITANALGLLAFRHFVSLDGPMHLLHAAVQRDAWSGITRKAEGMWVAAGALDLNLGDLLLIVLTGHVHPFLLHKLFAALAITSVCAGGWKLVKAYGAEVNAAWLLVLPLSFGFVVMLGLFHFMIAVGIALWLAGWWVSRPVIGWRGSVSLIIGCGLVTFAHKAGGGLLLMLIATHEMLLLSFAPDQWRRRWPGSPKWLMPACIAGLALAGALILYQRYSGPTVHPTEPHRPFHELITLRQFLLVDSVAERPFRIALGLALLLLVALAVRHRYLDRRMVPSDALLVSSLLLVAVSLVRTPRTELLYITDRSQWLALILLACWLASQRLPVRVLRALGLCVLLLHALRLVFIERRMNAYLERDEAVLAAARSFGPGSLVVPVVLDDDWLARHRTAYAAIGFRGLVFTGRDHLRITWGIPPDVHVRNYIYSYESDWRWIGKHIRKGIAPELGQVLVVGERASEGGTSWKELESTLHTHYRQVVADEHARLWTLHPE